MSLASKRRKTKPRKQYYGGSDAAGQRLARTSEVALGDSNDLTKEGTQSLRYEREQAGAANRGLQGESSAVEGELGRAAKRYGRTAGAGTLAYQGGRGAQLQDASTLESGGLDAAARARALGESLPGRYQSVADRKFAASTAANTRAALGLAAGRGNDAIRTALATQEAGNRQALLDQQATTAAEQNDIIGLQQQALQQEAGIRQNAAVAGAGIRSGVGSQDLQLAQQAAQRQQVAQQQQASRFGQRAEIQSRDQALGLATGEGLTSAGTTTTGQYLGAQTAQNTAQLGADVGYDLGRVKYEEENTPQAKFKRSIDPGGLLFK